MGDRVLSVVPRQSHGSPWFESGRARSGAIQLQAGARTRGCSVAAVSHVRPRLAAVLAIFLPDLRLVLLCHLAADISEKRAASGDRLIGDAECAASVSRRSG